MQYSRSCRSPSRAVGPRWPRAWGRARARERALAARLAGGKRIMGPCGVGKARGDWAYKKVSGPRKVGGELPPTCPQRRGPASEEKAEGRTAHDSWLLQHVQLPALRRLAPPARKEVGVHACTCPMMRRHQAPAPVSSPTRSLMHTRALVVHAHTSTCSPSPVHWALLQCCMIVSSKRCDLHRSAPRRHPPS